MNGSYPIVFTVSGIIIVSKFLKLLPKTLSPILVIPGFIRTCLISDFLVTLFEKTIDFDSILFNTPLPDITNTLFFNFVFKSVDKNGTLFLISNLIFDIFYY